MKVVGVRSRLGAPPSFQLPLTIHNTENFVHIELSLHLEIKETSLFLFQSFISRFCDGRNTDKVNTQYQVAKGGVKKQKNVEFSTLTGLAGQPKCGKSYTFLFVFFILRPWHHVPLVYPWCVTGVLLMYRWCIICVSLVYYWCITGVSLLCHSYFSKQ